MRKAIGILFVLLIGASAALAQICRACPDCEPVTGGYYNCISYGSKCAEWDDCPSARLGFYF